MVCDFEAVNREQQWLVICYSTRDADKLLDEFVRYVGKSAYVIGEIKV